VPRFARVNLWVREPGLAASIEASRVNDIFLPEITLPDRVHAVDQFEAALTDADIVLSVMPSHVVRNVYSQMLPWLKPGVKIVSATKGLEERTLLRMTQVIRSVAGPEAKIAVLSGPTFAREVAAGSPTAVVVASEDSALVEETQRQFSGPTFRVYGSPDVTGVEMGGSLKNVIAIGAGISDGLGLGHNALAALITRGLAELTRLAVAAGARAETLSGLAGLGDLVLTCTGDLSRNRQVGLKLASGLALGQILESTQTIAEGVKTTSVALELAARYGVDLPIAREMYAVLHLGRAPEEAIRNLMSRTLRPETGN
jgi:glycerol-3-phosphate dehydrogenase (NAD(P)+)